MEEMVRGYVSVPVEARWLDCGRKRPLSLATRGEVCTVFARTVVSWEQEMVPAAIFPGAPLFSSQFAVCLLHLSGGKLRKSGRIECLADRESKQVSGGIA